MAVAACPSRAHSMRIRAANISVFSERMVTREAVRCLGWRTVCERIVCVDGEREPGVKNKFDAAHS